MTPMTEQVQTKFLSLREIDESPEIPLTLGHARKLVFNREIPYTKVGAKVVIARADIEAWLDARRIPAKAAQTA